MIIKKNIRLVVFLLIGILSLGLFVGCSTEKTITNNEAPVSSNANNSNTPVTSSNDFIGYGAVGAAADKALTMEKMLVYAIQDEYLARGEYEYILENFGDQNPFSNIVRAEEQHIAELKILFDEYNLEVPKDISKEYIIVPDSIEEALKIGIQAEIDNIAMYKRFLEQELPDDVKSTLMFLMEGSESHLAAFQRKLKSN